MDPRTQDDRILLMMQAEEKGERYVALPCDKWGWEVWDMKEGKALILCETIQQCIAESVAKIINLSINPITQK